MTQLDKNKIINILKFILDQFNFEVINLELRENKYFFRAIRFSIIYKFNEKENTTNGFVRHDANEEVTALSIVEKIKSREKILPTEPKISKLYQLRKIIQKKEELDKFRPLPLELEKNLEEWFKIELTYTSNAIEGNTLTRQETALVVEKGITVEGKTINEHLEAKNTAEAYDFIKTLLDKKEISENDILDIHKIILQKIDDQNAGKYRNTAVRIAGSETILPNPIKVPELMSEFVKWLNQSADEHPVKLALDAHFKFVSIHPFADGNGRTARHLMNLILKKNDYVPIFISKEERKKYVTSLEKGQVTGDLSDYYNLMFEAEGKALNVYLDAVKKK